MHEGFIEKILLKKRKMDEMVNGILYNLTTLDDTLEMGNSQTELEDYSDILVDDTNFLIEDDDDFIEDIEKFVEELYNGEFGDDVNIKELFFEADTNIVDNQYIAQEIGFDGHNPDIVKDYKKAMKLAGNEYLSSYRSISEEVNCFIKQAKFIDTLVDEYKDKAIFEEYSIRYYDLTLEQFRTYVTWKGNLKKGNFYAVSEGYFYLYVYELIHNIGVKDEYEALSKLMYIWDKYREYSTDIDYHMINWIGDYYVAYDFKESFYDLMKGYNNTLINSTYFLMEISDNKFMFDFYNTKGRYNILESAFYNESMQKDVEDCFVYILDNIDKYLTKQGKEYNDVMYSKSTVKNVPLFRNALYDFSKYVDKSVLLSKTHFYDIKDGILTRQVTSLIDNITAHIIGYVIKRMEMNMRSILGYKYKLSPKRSAVINAVRGLYKFNKSKYIFLYEDSFDACIDEAVRNYYINVKKMPLKVDNTNYIKEVSIDFTKLEGIRQDANDIAAKLTIDDTLTYVASSVQEGAQKLIDNKDVINKENINENINKEAIYKEEINKNTNKIDTFVDADTTTNDSQINNNESNEWQEFINALDKAQLSIIKAILNGNGNNCLKDIAKQNKLMPEVIIDGINELAIEYVGDSIIEVNAEILEIYEDYLYNVTKVIGG